MTTTIDGNSGIIFPNSTTQASAGQVLQVVNTTTTSGISTSSSSFVTTGFSVSITPKFSTSKILVLLMGGTADNGSTTPSVAISTTIYRSSTNLGNATYGLVTSGGISGSRNNAPLACSVLDSPATTSSTTYTAYCASTNTAGTVNFNTYGSTLTFIAMEIAA